MSHRKQLTGRRVVHKSTGGILPSIPEPVDAVGNAAPLKSNTVALSGLTNCEAIQPGLKQHERPTALALQGLARQTRPVHLVDL